MYLFPSNRMVSRQMKGIKWVVQRFYSTLLARKQKERARESIAIQINLNAEKCKSADGWQ